LKKEEVISHLQEYEIEVCKHTTILNKKEIMTSWEERKFWFLEKSFAQNGVFIDPQRMRR
jgi:hypothetical protein